MSQNKQVIAALEAKRQALTLGRPEPEIPERLWVRAGLPVSEWTVYSATTDHRHDSDIEYVRAGLPESNVRETASNIAQNIIKLGEWRGRGYESEIIQIASEAITAMRINMAAEIRRAQRAEDFAKSDRADLRKRIERLISMNPDERSAAMKRELSRYSDVQSSDPVVYVDSRSRAEFTGLSHSQEAELSKNGEQDELTRTDDSVR